VQIAHGRYELIAATQSVAQLNGMFDIHRDSFLHFHVFCGAVSMDLKFLRFAHL
jgi:hypothetical protein